jgi:molecular chaperone HscB
VAVDFSQNHFALFGLEPAYLLDSQALDKTFRLLQQQVHPDNFASANAAEQRVAMQWAVRVNEAFQTLKSPLARGRYLLKLRGIDTLEETNTSMPLDFLMQQMDVREALSELKKNPRAANVQEQLDGLQADFQVQEKALFAALAIALEADLNAAAITVRKLRFLEKLREELDETFALVDA